MLLNSLGLAAVSAVLYLVLRQLGYVLRRITPSGARSSPDGPRIGENVTLHIPELAGEPRSALVVFVSTECSICAVVRAGAEELARTWRGEARIFLVYDGSGERDETDFIEVDAGIYQKRSFGLRRALGTSFVPFAFVTDGRGTVVGKGLVNEVGHLESLLEVARTR
jgi:hypothetical protein